MAAPTNFILGIKTVTLPAGGTIAGILKVTFNDNTRLDGEGSDDDTELTQTWSGPRSGSGSVSCRDPLTAQTMSMVSSAANAGAPLIVIGKNRNSGGSDRTHTFSNVQFSQPGGDMAGGSASPESLSVNFHYGKLVIT